MQTQLRDVEIDRRLRGRSEMEAGAQAGGGGHRTAARPAVGLEDLAAAEALLAAEQEHVFRIERLGAQLEGLVGKEPVETLPGLRDAAALEIEQKTHALEALGPIAREPRARERLEVEVRDLEASLERARDDEANARARVEGNMVDAEAVAAHAERLASWQEQLVALQRRARVYDRTLREIELAEQATMKSATRYLETKMVADIERVTDGRYRRVAVDDKTLDIRLHAPERGDWVDVSVTQPGHARSRLPRRPDRARPARHRRPPAAAHPRRPVRDPRRRPSDPRARAPPRRRERLPGDLPDDLGSLRLGRPTRSSRWPARPRSTTSPTASAIHRAPPTAELLGPGSAVVILGLGSAIAWGAGDFGGGWASRRGAGPRHLAHRPGRRRPSVRRACDGRPANRSRDQRRSRSRLRPASLSRSGSSGCTTGSRSAGWASSPR